MKSIIFFIIVVLLSVFIFSCNPAKKIEKKDKEALSRVEAKIELLNHAGLQWFKLNPCYPDTVKVGVVVTHVDSTSQSGRIDSLNATIDYLISNYNNTNLDSLKRAISLEVEKRCKPIVITRIRIDTMPPDRRAIELLQGQLISAQLTVSNLTGQISEKAIEINDLKKQKTKTMWFTIAGGMLALLIIIFLAYIIIRGKK